jgi:hypothetical protein
VGSDLDGEALRDNLSTGGVIVDRDTAVDWHRQGPGPLAIRSKAIAVLGMLLVALLVWGVLRRH